MLNRRPRDPLCWVMAFFTASYQHILWTPTHQGPNGPFGLMWLSLPHLVYNSVPLQLQLELDFCLDWVQHPLSRLLHLWNGMINRHPAEITVMQFTGYSLRCISLWVYHGNFFSSSHFISQFPPTRFPLITAIRMCPLLPVHHLGMAFLAGSKVKIQQ